MSSTQRKRLAAALATAGAGAMVLGGASLPATAAETKPDSAPVGEVGDLLSTAVLEEATLSGPEALNQLDNNGLKLVAERAGMAVDEVTQLLKDDLALVSPSGYLAHKDKFEVPDTELPQAADADIPGSPEEGSKPGAPVTIYLDFDGAEVRGTAWNEENGEVLTAAPAASADAAYQRIVWETVAEDYAPFDVNVTTTDPGPDALQKTSLDDEEYGSWAVITDSYDELPFAPGTGGIAYVGAVGARYLSPAWVFTEGVSDNPKYVGDVTSHEVGHNFGLSHDGSPEGEEYYSPSDPATTWAPIMGGSYIAPLAQWNNGDYTNANNTEDDLALITEKGAIDGGFILLDADGNSYVGQYYCEGTQAECDAGDGTYTDLDGNPLTAEKVITDRTNFSEDDHGDDVAGATGLENTSGEFAGEGVIGRTGEVDVFGFVTNGGPFTAKVDPASPAQNLDAKLQLLDANGEVVAENNPESAADPGNAAADYPLVTGVNASLEQELEAGAYYLAVSGVGQGDPQQNTETTATNYSNYGSLGNYSLSGTAAPFEAEPVTITSPEDGAEVAAADLEVTGTADPGASVALTVGDAAAGEATAAEDGTWSATLTEDLPFGESTITAQQTVGTIVVPEKASVTVSVALDAPTVTKPEEGQTASTARPTFAGKGVPGATVNVSIDAEGDAPVAGSATVDDDGNWEFVPEADLANGAHTVSATQTVGEATSAASETVNFNVEVTAGDDNGGDDNGDESGDAGGGDGNDDLPDTGSSSAGLIGFAAGLVLLGAGAAVYARTRRSTV